MLDLLKELFAAHNLPYTALLGLVLLYWLSVMIGALDADSIHIDTDGDVDFDGPAHLEGHGGMSGFGKALSFFNIGKAPFMVLFSLLSAFMWAIAVLSNHYAGPFDGTDAIPLFLGSFTGGLFFAKYASIPFANFYKSLEKGEKMEIVGKVGILKSSLENDRVGQGELFASNKMLALSVQSHDGKPIPYGSKIIVIEHLPEKGVHLVALYDDGE